MRSRANFKTWLKYCIAYKPTPQKKKKKILVGKTESATITRYEVSDFLCDAMSLKYVNQNRSEKDFTQVIHIYTNILFQFFHSTADL